MTKTQFAIGTSAMVLFFAFVLGRVVACAVSQPQPLTAEEYGVYWDKRQGVPQKGTATWVGDEPPMAGGTTKNYSHMLTDESGVHQLAFRMTNALGKFMWSFHPYHGDVIAHAAEIKRELGDKGGWLCIVRDDNGKPGDVTRLCERVEVGE